MSSSIWLKDDETRIVWITLLALCDRDGIVRASPLGLAHQARVSPKGCERALEELTASDPDSRSPDYEGKRIERVNGGFLVLNYNRVLSEGAREERREYNRKKQAESRAKKKSKVKLAPKNEPPTGSTLHPDHPPERTLEEEGDEL